MLYQRLILTVIDCYLAFLTLRKWCRFTDLKTRLCESIWVPRDTHYISSNARPDGCALSKWQMFQVSDCVHIKAYKGHTLFEDLRTKCIRFKDQMSWYG